MNDSFELLNDNKNTENNAVDSIVINEMIDEKIKYIEQHLFEKIINHLYCKNNSDDDTYICDNCNIEITNVRYNSLI